MGFGSEFPMALNWLRGRDTESHQPRLWSIIQLRNWMYEMSCFVVLTRLQMCLQDKIKGNLLPGFFKMSTFLTFPGALWDFDSNYCYVGNSSGMKNELTYRNRNKSKWILSSSANSTQSFLIWPTFYCDSCLQIPPASWTEEVGRLMSPAPVCKLHSWCVP